MDIINAKETVIEAGKRLVEQGLISRTWGNVSCRIDNKSFVITPSGKPYETLTPEQIVLVNIETLEYGGDVKPSSEKGVHAEVYKAHPEMNFVIHTHQKNASIISALGSDIKTVPPEAAQSIGTEVPLAAYGLPGTKTLRKGVADALERSSSKAIIMAHHGALCFGEDSGKAFESALMLESVCANAIFARFKQEFGEDIQTIPEFIEGMAKKAFITEKDVTITGLTGYNSTRLGGNFSLASSDGNTEPVLVNIATGKAVNGNAPLPLEASLHRAIYLERPDINTIIHSCQSEKILVSSLGKTVKPQLDDFAQIVGIDVKCTVFDKENAETSVQDCARALKGRHGVLLKGYGALCCGSCEGDARAVEMIMEKNCLTFLGTLLFNANKPISALDARLMRYIYLKKYSKQAE